MTPNKTNPARHGFTLIELLVVISIIGILAGFGIVVYGSVTKNRKVATARGELEIIKAALDLYHAKYNAYPPGNPGLALTNQLYYELSGVTLNSSTATFTTLDGSASITRPNYLSIFGSGGILNSTKGGGEDAAAAKNFLAGLSSKMFGTYTSGGIGVTNLVTSVGGPDFTYLSGLSAHGFSGNPFRYVYPGVKNPNGYDLWVQVVTKPGTTNLVCNWSSANQVNTLDP